MHLYTGVNKIHMSPDNTKDYFNKARTCHSKFPPVFFLNKVETFHLHFFFFMWKLKVLMKAGENVSYCPHLHLHSCYVLSSSSSSSVWPLWRHKSEALIQLRAGAHTGALLIITQQRLGGGGLILRREKRRQICVIHGSPTVQHRLGLGVQQKGWRFSKRT